MAMEKKRNFNQSDLIKSYESTTQSKLPTPGICFRVTFKWAACMLYGGEFKYDQLNVVKTANKHVAYRKQTLAYADDKPDWTNDKVLAEYADLDARETLAFTNQWGVSITDAKKTVYNGLYVEEQLRIPLWEYIPKSKNLAAETIVMTFYGRINSNGAVGPAGHAVAFCGKGPAFFDANNGLYHFSDPSPIAIAKDIESYVAEKCWFFTHEHFTLLRLNTLMLPNSMMP